MYILKYIVSWSSFGAVNRLLSSYHEALMALYFRKWFDIHQDLKHFCTRPCASSRLTHCSLPRLKVLWYVYIPSLCCPLLIIGSFSVSTSTSFSPFRHVVAPACKRVPQNFLHCGYVFLVRRSLFLPFSQPSTVPVVPSYKRCAGSSSYSIFS